MFSLTFLLVFPPYLASLSSPPIALGLLMTSLAVVAAVAVVLLWQRLKNRTAERDRLEHSLSQAIEQTQVMLRTIRDGVITTNAQGQVELLNPVAEQITGWQTQEAQGRSLSEILPLRDAATGEMLPSLPENAAYEARALSHAASAALLKRRDQSERRVDSARIEIHAPTGQMTSSIVVLREAAPANPSHPTPNWQDRYDALTGLVNRQEFEHCLQQAITLTQLNDQEHSLCLLDLDRFREINQNCGYVAGDELLRQVSRLLQSKVRKADTIARLGGDEFAVLLYQCPTEQAMYVAQSLCEAVENLWFNWQGQSFPIGVSIGLVNLAANSDSATALKAADKACSIAKTQNRGGVHFYQTDQPSSGSRARAEQILQALEANRLRLHRQKIVLLQDGSAEKREEAFYDVLLTLVDTAGNAITADMLMAAAEQQHLTTMIDRWVVTTLFASQSNIRQSNADRSQNSCYSIKISESSVADPEFLNFLKEQLSTYSILPQRICCEVSEAVLQKSLRSASQFLQSLKQMGFRVALRNSSFFGVTGHLSGSPMTLAYLADLPIDYLRISGTVIQQLPSNSLMLVMMEGIHLIAHRLGIKTIAESIPTPEMQSQLTAIGIDYAQGNGIAKPEVLLPSQQTE